MSVSYPEQLEGGATMDGMTAPAHAKPASRDRLLWIVAVIAAFALYDVWGAWTEVGDKSGFAHGTGWTLTVIVEAFGICALVAWLADAPGPRSRRFAMWSAVIVFALSLVGQASSHLTARSQIPPAAVVVFVSVLPVIVLALGAVLIHLRIKDRAEAAEAERSEREAARRAAAEADEVGERAALRAQVDALTTELDTRHGVLMSELEAERSAHATAQQDLAEALTRAEKLAAKLAVKNAQQARTKKQESAHDEDITTEFKALDELQKDPSLRAPRMGAELGRRIGVSPATGRRLHAKLTAQEQSGESLSERSADQSDERSGERS